MNSKTLLFIYPSLLIFLVGPACRPQIAPTLDETQMVSTWSLDDALLTDVAETTTPVTSETAIEPEHEPAGQIERISDRVELGALDGALLPLEDVAPFYSGDAVRVRDGGEGLLDFGDQMRLRLFNDSRIEMVAVESEPGAPLDVRMFLVEGGFTGELLVEGGRAEFDTPGGATIVVLGTDFYVASDQQREVTYVGNFEGSAEVRFDGDRLVVPSNTTIILPQRERVPLTMTREQFEQLARELQSPVAAAMTASATPTPTVTSTSTPRSTTVPTLIPTPSSTPSAMPTLTATPTSTETAMPTLTATPTSTETAMPTPTATPSYTPTAVLTQTVTPTIVVTVTATIVPTATPTPAPVTSEGFLHIPSKTFDPHSEYRSITQRCLFRNQRSLHLGQLRVNYGCQSHCRGKGRFLHFKPAAR